MTFHQIEIPRTCPKEGWVEQDGNLLLNSTLTCIDKAVENLKKLGIDPSDIKAIGITNQRETVVVWDKFTGQPLYNAIGIFFHLYLHFPTYNLHCASI